MTQPYRDPAEMPKEEPERPTREPWPKHKKQIARGIACLGSVWTIATVSGIATGYWRDTLGINLVLMCCGVVLYGIVQLFEGMG